MYAVIKTGGKQYRVKEGDVLKVELLLEEVGQEIVIPEVLMVANDDQITCGAPLLSDVTVKATVLAHARHKKIRIIKFRRRKHHMKQMGHRQHYTQIKITAINQ